MASPIVDVHTPLFGIDEEHLLAEMGRAGVDYAVLSTVEVTPLPSELKAEIRGKLKQRFESSSSRYRALTGYHSFNQVETFLASFDISQLMPSNDKVAKAVQQHPQKLIGFGSVDPNGDERYIERKLAEITTLGLRGIKLIPTFQFFNPAESKNFARICDYCQKNNLIIFYHSGCDPGPFEIPELSEDANPKYLMPVLDKYNPVMIIAHMGAYSALDPGIWLDGGLELMGRYENVHGDTAAVGHVVYSEANIERLREIGIEKTLFGSDYPTVSESTIKYEVDRVKGCPYLTEEEKAKILGLNAMRLLELKVE